MKWLEQVNLPIVSNHYWNRYVKLINMVIERDLQKGQGVYLESHHAWPKSHKGVNLPFNLVLFTAREHFIAHKLIWLALKTNKMRSAYVLMCNRTGEQSKRKPTTDQ